MTLVSGSRLGPYEIVALLGAGGMGVVYRARDERLQRDVAVKILPPGVLTNEAARSRFRKEARALAKLSHPNIAAVYDVGEQDGMDYLVMECVPGESLAAKLQSGPLSVKDVLSLGVQFAAALEDAHEQGVVHRDLKPANIMVTPKGQAKVLDFGLAKLLRPADGGNVSQSLTETRGPVGTVLYMSPEQASGDVVDSRTDLWSFGVVLYESLAGSVPFQGTVPWAVLRAVTQDTPKPLRELRPDVPAAVESIVSRALAKDASKRYQSASEISRDASAVLAQLSGAAPLSGSRSPRPALVNVVTAAIAIVLLTGQAVPDDCVLPQCQGAGHEQQSNTRRHGVLRLHHPERPRGAVSDLPEHLRATSQDRAPWRVPAHGAHRSALQGSRALARLPANPG
jgi:serine/threonine protein kinase